MTTRRARGVWREHEGRHGYRRSSGAAASGVERAEPGEREACFIAVGQAHGGGHRSGEAHGSACTRGVWVDAPAALQPHRIARLAGHVNEMDSNGWKDAAETIRALIAAYGVLEVGRG